MATTTIWPPGSMMAGLHAEPTPLMNATSGVEPNTSAVTDNPVNANLQFYNFFVNVYIDGLLCILGYFGNILTIVVLQRDKVRSSNAVFLQALAVFDSMFLTYVVFYVVLRSIPPYTGYLQGYAAINAYIVTIVLPFGWTSQTCTIWIVMVIAIDRYLVVSRPLKASLWCTPKNARKVVVCVFVAAALFNSPRWPHYYYVAFVASPNSGATFISHLAFSNTFWDENLYRKIYHQSLAFILLFIIPLSIIVTLNALLVITIKNAMRARQAMTNNVQSANSKNQQSESNLNLNRMMVILISIFVVCELPDFIASIIGASNTKVDPVVYKYYAVMKECLLVLNSAINFYMYCIFYKKFRASLSDLFGCAQDPASRRESASSANGKALNKGTSMGDVRSIASQQTVDSNLSGSSTRLSNLSLSQVVCEEPATKL